MVAVSWLRVTLITASAIHRLHRPYINNSIGVLITASAASALRRFTN
jgi:hypothetical protein